ncbi:MAG: hypothetical protein NTY53_26135, partial [Kiritimatiellaeota bacterium]|nr:hypothetical protein [Kiritimatiellota bacterium]
QAARAELGAGAPAADEDMPPQLIAEEPASYAAAPAPASRPAAPPPAAEDELAKLTREWPKIVKQLSQIEMKAKCLVDARPMSVVGDHVIIAFDPEFAIEVENVRDSRTQKVVQNALRDVLGRAIAVEFKVRNAAAPTAPVAPPDGAAPKSAPKDKRDWHKHPAVNNVLEAFNGDIGEVRG